MRLLSDPAAHLEWRIRLFGSGAILALVGIFFEVRWMIWIAIGVLLAGFSMRFVGGGATEESGEGADSTEE